MGELAGKVVLITGAGNGIGRECALAAARAGASVVVNDIGSTMEGVGGSTRPAQQVAEEIAAFGGNAVFNTETVVSLDGVRRMVEQARDAFGALHAVVHPAGIVRRAPLATMSEEDWDLVMDTHLRGAFNVTRATMQMFLDQGEGAYVFFTSAAGQFGQVELASYAAAKMGVIGLNKVIAMETAGTGVVSNVVSPFAWTRMVESLPVKDEATAKAMALAKETMRADQVARLVVALCSRRAGTSGQVFGARGNEVILFSDAAPTRSVAAIDGWTPEAIIDQVLPAMKPGYSKLATPGQMFRYRPL